jgi:hypothetical protein
MEMPTSCCECFAFKSNASGQLFCKAKRIAFGKEDAEWLPLKTPNWCPLVPVPPHGRLIDADALPWIEGRDEQDNPAYLLIKKCVDVLPTIIPAEEGE